LNKVLVKNSQKIKEHVMAASTVNISFQEDLLKKLINLQKQQGNKHGSRDKTDNK
jgi:hypothetical protein